MSQSQKTAFKDRNKLKSINDILFLWSYYQGCKRQLSKAYEIAYSIVNIVTQNCNVFQVDIVKQIVSLAYA